MRDSQNLLYLNSKWNSASTITIFEITRAASGKYAEAAFVVKSKAANGPFSVIKDMELVKMFNSNRSQKLFVRYKYKLIVSVMVLMALDALLIKGFIDMYTATLNGSF